jgi:hypothetical protein
MSRLDVNALFRLRLDPSADNAPTRKDQRMRAGLVDHGELQIVFEWSIRDRLPHILNSGQQFQSRLDLDHIRPQFHRWSFRRLDLDQNRTGGLRRWLRPMKGPRATIRTCPLCGIAMQGSKSKESLPTFDTFKCQICDTTIREIKTNKGVSSGISPSGGHRKPGQI